MQRHGVIRFLRIGRRKRLECQADSVGLASAARSCRSVRRRLLTGVIFALFLLSAMFGQAPGISAYAVPGCSHRLFAIKIDRIQFLPELPAPPLRNPFCGVLPGRPTLLDHESNHQAPWNIMGEFSFNGGDVADE